MSQQGQLLNTRGMSSAREMRKIQRERIVKELGIKKRDLGRSRGEPPPNAEFNLPDEDRDHTLLIGNCWVCGWAGQHYLRTFTEDGKKFFQIYCRNPNCNNETLPLKSSKLAIQNWKVTQALHK